MHRYLLVLLAILVPAATEALEVHQAWRDRVSAYGWNPPPAGVVEGSITGTFTAAVPIDLLFGDAGFVRTSPNSFTRVFTWDQPTPVVAIFGTAGGEVDTLSVVPAPLPLLVPGSPALPVVNLDLDPAALWSATTGLYVWGTAAPNWNQEGAAWEREATLSLWDAAGELVTQRLVGVRINGGWTRCLPQKSLRLYFDHHDDPEEIVHDFFGSGPTTSERLLLRETMQAEYLLNDHWATAIYRDLGHLTSRWTPIVGYLNHEYWGLYGLRERLDDKWATTTLGFDEDDIILVKDGETDAGDPAAWPAFLAWAYTHARPASHDFYLEISRRFDLRAYTDWILINAFAGSAENGFTHNLVILRDPDQRWHYTMWDEDAILVPENLNADLLRFFAAVTPPEFQLYLPPVAYFEDFTLAVPFTRLFRALMANAEYRTLLAARADSLLSGPLAVPAAQARMDSVLAMFTPGLAAHAGRFAPSDLAELAAEVDSRQAFLAARHPIFQSQLASFREEYLAAVELSRFAAEVSGGLALLSWRTERERDNRGFEVWRAVGDSTAMARIASYTEDSELAGSLYSDAPRAYNFVDDDLPVGATVWYQLRHVAASGAVTVHDWYERLGPPPPGLVINEFLASNSSVNRDEVGEYEDWLEIFNPGSTPVELAGLYLTDDLDDPLQWALPTGSLPAGGFLLVWCDDEPGDGRYHASFKLSAGGEELALSREASGLTTTLDALAFPAQSANVSQGRVPDGGEAWRFYAEPTPGAANGGAVAVREDGGGEFVVRAVTPNPASGAASIRYAGRVTLPVRVEIYDLRGRCVRRLSAPAPAGGEKAVTWDRCDEGGRPAPAGIYLLRLCAGPQTVTRKLNLVR
jgi:hypothetical protein